MTVTVCPDREAAGGGRAKERSRNPSGVPGGAAIPSVLGYVARRGYLVRGDAGAELGRRGPFPGGIATERSTRGGEVGPGARAYPGQSPRDDDAGHGNLVREEQAILQARGTLCEMVSWWPGIAGKLGSWGAGELDAPVVLLFCFFLPAWSRPEDVKGALGLVLRSIGKTGAASAFRTGSWSELMDM